MSTYFKPGTYALVPNKHLLPQMKGAPLSVYITLCVHADAEGVCFPGIKRIMMMSGYNKDTVIQALKRLIGLGVIERTKRKTDLGDQDTNLYRILINDDVNGGTAHHTTGYEKVHGGGTAHHTTGGTAHHTLTNPSELTHLSNRESTNLESSKRPDHRGIPSPTVERMRKARAKGLKPWEALAGVA